LIKTRHAAVERFKIQMAIGTCEHKECSKDAMRHFLGHYFCNGHNESLRESVVEERPSDVEAYIKEQL